MRPTKWRSRIFLALATVIVVGWFLVWAGVLGFAVFGTVFHSSDEKQYSSQELGAQFSYSKNYTPTFRNDSYKGMPIQVLTLIDASTTVPDMSEGPTAISVIEIHGSPEGSLDEWIRASSISNFDLSPDKVLTHTTVGGEPAVAYSYSGLYESDAVAVVHGDNTYLFAVSWMNADDPIRTDFKNLLSSVKFK